MKPLLCLVVLFFGWASCQYMAPNCSYENWDLLPLQYNPTYAAPTGYSFSNSTTADIISVNFCAVVAASTQCTASTSTNPVIANPGSCQSFAGNPPSGAPQVLGDATTSTLSALTTPYIYGSNNFTDGVVLTYTGGAFCQKFNSNRLTRILVVCPPAGYTGLTEQIIATGEPGNCVYEVLFVSQHGCSGGGGGGEGGGEGIWWLVMVGVVCVLALICCIIAVVVVVIGLKVRANNNKTTIQYPPLSAPQVTYY